MAGNGVKSNTLQTASLADELLANRSGSTRRIPIDNLSAQLAASGPLAEKITSSTVLTDTWTALRTTDGTFDGQGGEVLDSDGGEHSQATASGYDGGTVNNAGRYSWKESWGRWVRIGATGLSSKASTTELAEAVDAASAVLRGEALQNRLEVDGMLINAEYLFSAEVDELDPAGKIPIVVASNGVAVLWWDIETNKIDGLIDVGNAVDFALDNFEGWRNASAFEYADVSDGIWPLAPVFSNGRMSIWYDEDDEKIHIPALDLAGLSLTVQPTTERVALASGIVAPEPSSSVIFGHHRYGQSLAIGAQGQPVLTTTQPFYNITFADSVKPSLTGNTYGGRNESDMDAAGPLVEDALSPDAATNRGETSTSATCNGAVELALIRDGLSPADYRYFGSTFGNGGESIEALIKTAPPDTSEGATTGNYYDGLIDHITQANAIVTGLGKTYHVAAGAWMQGESDADSIDAATYKGLLDALVDDFQADVMAITGQATAPAWLTYQPCYQATDAGASSLDGGPAQAMLDLASERDDVFLVTAIYHLPHHSDATHLTNVGYALVGRYFARALDDIVARRKEPLTLMPVSAWVRGSDVFVRFRVPQKPLVLDVVNLPATTNYGFKVTSDGGEEAISDISVEADGETIKIALADTPAANVKVRAGFDHLGAGLNINNGASTNLRDSTDDPVVISGTTYQTWYVCPHFILPAYTLS